MVDRTILGNGKSRMLRGPADMPTDFATWRSQLIAGTAYVDVLANNETTGSNAGVSSVGTPLNKENLLTDATASALGLSGNPTLNDAVSKIASDIAPPFPISKGGTGATSRKDGMQNLAYFGADPIGSEQDDTRVAWTALGTGYCHFTKIALKNQPSGWCTVFNFCYGTVVVQFLKVASGGGLWFRDGNANGWNNDWTMIYDSATGIIYRATQPGAVKGRIWLKPVE